ncbi:unknown [Brachyspira sp. CAG:484]|nr:unknown [Brachyspira sp. CAG:484]
MHNYEEKMKKTGENLRNLRLRRGLSVEQLALMINSEPAWILQCPKKFCDKEREQNFRVAY